jgi:ABC-type amino acid transport substrate-binding protein
MGVQAALKSMMADGSYGKILAKWNLSSGAVTP